MKPAHTRRPVVSIETQSSPELERIDPARQRRACSWLAAELQAIIDRITWADGRIDDEAVASIAHDGTMPQVRDAIEEVRSQLTGARELLIRSTPRGECDQRS